MIDLAKLLAERLLVDPCRSAWKKAPFVQNLPDGAWTFVTNGYAIVMCRGANAALADPIAPVPAWLTGRLTWGTPVGTTTVGALRAWAMEPPAEVKDERPDCKVCNGDGNCQCDNCGHEHDCVACDGGGKDGEAPFRPATPDDIGVVHAKPNDVFLARMVTWRWLASDLPDDLRFTVRVNAPRDVVWFLSDDIQVAQMPLRYDPDPERKPVPMPLEEGE